MDKSKWEYKKLTDVCSILYGYPFDSKCFNDNNQGRPLIRIRDVVRGFTETYTTEKCPDEYIISEGDLLIGMDGEFNISAWKSEPALLNQRVCKIKADDKNIIDGFMYYLMKTKLKEIESETAFVTVKHLSAKVLNKVNVQLPSIADQQRIVAELDCLNEMIALKQEQLKEFDKLAQSIFYDMFGDSDGYEKVKLGDVVEVVSGLVDPNTEPYCSQLHVSPANIVGGTNEIVNCVQAKSEGLISDKYPFKAGMILYSKIRPNLNKVAIARFDGICSADMYPLSVLPKANNVYITKLLSSKQFLDYAIKNSGRARMPKLNRETLFSYSFNLPPLALQQQFAEKIQAIEAQKELVKKSIAETQHLLDSRMDYYFD